MAKVFVSFLGTNDYIPCNYYLDKDRSLNIDNLSGLRNYINHAGFENQPKLAKH